MKGKGLLLADVMPGTAAARAGLKIGDRILKVDHQKIDDALDLAYATAEEEFVLQVAKSSGRIQQVAIQREFGKPWGGAVEPPPLKYCGNRCVFCFVDQMPAGLRSSLYVKDEDYRHSFLFGNYITLTNLSEYEIQRIIRMRLSPLYISVHATDPGVRRRLLGRKKIPPVFSLLKKLAKAGIQMHAQAVLCPGWNDGPVLARTVQDLVSLFPAIRSLALVPVGLTVHRRGLPLLRSFTSSEAKDLLRQLQQYQKDFLKRLGTRWVYATDEFYCSARKAFPVAATYEDFPQIENGVGIARQFLDDVRSLQKKLPPVRQLCKKVLVVSGELSASIVKKALRPFNLIPGLDVHVVPVLNHLFGTSVGVSGLLSGQDIQKALQPLAKQADLILIPPEPVRYQKGVFLDGMRVATLSRRLQTPVRVAKNPQQLVQLILQR